MLKIAFQTTPVGFFLIPKYKRIFKQHLFEPKMNLLNFIWGNIIWALKQMISVL